MHDHGKVQFQSKVQLSTENLFLNGRVIALPVEIQAYFTYSVDFLTGKVFHQVQLGTPVRLEFRRMKAQARVEMLREKGCKLEHLLPFILVRVGKDYTGHTAFNGPSDREGNVLGEGWVVEV